jgi:hypothetical protein
MKSLKILLMVAALFATNACYDDDDLRRSIDDLQTRVKALEEWAETVNGNIAALQNIIIALQNNDYVTGVTPFTSPAPGGYTVTFTKSDHAIIWNGANGQDGQKGDDGHSPQISAQQDEDGIYYWTLDDEWIIVDGHKLRVTGDNGITPQIRINAVTNFWEISYDNGSTWTSLNILSTGAKGEKGDKGDTGDAIFAENGIDNSNADYVEFTLADGVTKIRIPKYMELSISFTQPNGFIAGQTRTIGYTITGNAAFIKVLDLPTGWKATVDTVAKEISITAPAIFTADNIAGDALVVVSDGKQITITRILSLAAPTIEFTFTGTSIEFRVTAPSMTVDWGDGTTNDY